MAAMPAISVSRITCCLLLLLHIVFGFHISCNDQAECIQLSACIEKHKLAGKPLGEDSPALGRCSNTQDKYCCPTINSTAVPDQPRVTQVTTVKTTTEPTVQSPQDIKVRLLPPQDQCGWSSKYTYQPLTIDNKISDGKIAPRGAMPWMVMLFYGPKNNQGHAEQYPRCGGSLISTKYVLTAAHCLTLPVDLKFVRIGAHQVGDNCKRIESEIKRLFNGKLIAAKQCFVDIKPVKIINHPNFNNDGTLKNDIALIRLADSGAPKDNVFIGPACLPFKNFATVQLNETFYAAGWGATEWDQVDVHELDFILRNVTIQGTGICSMCDSPSALCPLDDRTQLCIQAERGVKDVCKGDSGGPIMVRRAQQLLLVGVVSAKPTQKCGSDGVPSVYTRVDGFIDWILSNIQE